MNYLISLLQSSVAAALGRTLLHSLWEGATIAVALAAVLCATRSARVRYGAACLAMLMLVSGLVITFARLAPEEPSHFARPATHSLVAPSGLITLQPLPPQEPRTVDELAWLAPFWIAGVLVFYLRGVSGWLAALRLRKTGVCCPPDLWQENLARLAKRLQIAKTVALLESCLAEVPVVIGYVRPVILMPVGLLASLPTAQAEAILLHELAHIRRYDYLVNLLQVFAEGLLFYHPAVWWISGVMRAERENCCDDLVVGVTGGAYEYAQALTALEQRRENAGLALAATGGSLVNRIQRLIGGTERRYVMAMPVVTAGILTVTVVTAMAALQFGTAPRTISPPVPAPTSAKPVLFAQAQQAQPVATPAPAKSSVPPATPAAQPEPREFVQQFWLRRDPQPPKNMVQLTAPVRTFAPQLAAASVAPYERWLNEDVAYISSDEERKAFRQLTTDDEREKFIEQFWARRDPTPGTPRNEFKEEHYRRISYVNDHYGSPNSAGWRSDRGRIYIQFGPPDEIESHAAGGAYQRPTAQGGGTTETYPFEQWRYRYIDRIGQNIILEFVDTKMNGEYRMTMDPSEKDALIHAVAPPR